MYALYRRKRTARLHAISDLGPKLRFCGCVPLRPRFFGGEPQPKLAEHVVPLGPVDPTLYGDAARVHNAFAAGGQAARRLENVKVNDAIGDTLDVVGDGLDGGVRWRAGRHLDRCVRFVKTNGGFERVPHCNHGRRLAGSQRVVVEIGRAARYDTVEAGVPHSLFCIAFLASRNYGYN